MRGAPIHGRVRGSCAGRAVRLMTRADGHEAGLLSCARTVPAANRSWPIPTNATHDWHRGPIRLSHCRSEFRPNRPPRSRKQRPRMALQNLHPGFKSGRRIHRSLTTRAKVGIPSRHAVPLPAPISGTILETDFQATAIRADCARIVPAFAATPLRRGKPITF